MPRLYNRVIPNPLLFEEEAGVAVTEEAEVVCEGVVVEAAPVVFTHESRHQQKQGALWLMEVGDHAADDAILKSRGNHHLRAAHVGGGMMAVEIVDDVLQRLLGGNLTWCGVRASTASR